MEEFQNCLFLNLRPIYAKAVAILWRRSRRNVRLTAEELQARESIPIHNAKILVDLFPDLPISKPKTIF